MRTGPPAGPVAVDELVPAPWRARFVGRLLLAAAALLLLIDRTGSPIAAALLPVQRALFEWAMPDFELHRFELARLGAHLKVKAVSVNRRYLVVRQRAVRPGFEFTVETPARSGLLHAALVLGGLALVLPARRRGLLVALAIGLPAAMAMAIVSVPLALAGEQCGLNVEALGELSAEALLVALSGFLLHGGGFAVCAAAVWAAALAARGAR